MNNLKLCKEIKKAICLNREEFDNLLSSIYNELTIDKKNFIREEKFLEYTGLDFLEFSKSSSELLELLNSIMKLTQYNSEEYELRNQIIRTIPPQDLYTGNSLICTKSEDCLGCYDEDNDFTTIYYRTSIKSMYEVWTSNTCSHTSCYERFQQFIWLKNSEVNRLKEESDNVEIIGSLY